ncbi:MAG: hypothetical protein GF383_04285, partial [Candidatus Lokiarchaeota archaeon]|nr:hypothetical protein [Candidatus Lokiarchaeota archaeon]MBD3338976.1 hypothetical protein [Candidatus Lokiarchaeota archaeon]
MTITKNLIKRKGYCVFLITLIISNFLFGASIFFLSNTSLKNYEEIDSGSEDLNDISNLKCSEDPLSYTNIYQNTTLVRRVYESVYFQINVSDFEPQGANYTEIEITYSNNSLFKENMTLQSGTSNNFTYTYTPRYYDPLGYQNVVFAIYNISSTILNTKTTKTNFTIRANCAAILNNTDYKKDEYVSAQLVIEGSSNFDWVIDVVNNTIEGYQKSLFGIGENLFDFTFTINESFEQVSTYYIKVNLTRTSDDKFDVYYFKFYILKPDSVIISSSINFNPSSVFRTEICQLTLNTSYIDNNLIPAFLNISLSIKDPNDNTAVSVAQLDNNLDGTFKTSFSVDEDRPAGQFRYTLKATYKTREFEEYSGKLTIKNNPPDIDGYTISDYETGERISILYGEELVFEFDVDDIEGLSYLTLTLENEEGDEYIISREYDDDLEITVRTVDLVTGTWTIYVSVTDEDGATTELDSDYDDAPQQITIIPDLLSDIIPWIMLI